MNKPLIVGVAAVMAPLMLSGASAPNVVLCPETIPVQPIASGPKPGDMYITSNARALFVNTKPESPEPPHFEPVREIEPAPIQHMIQPIMATYQDEAAYPPFAAVFKSAD